MTSMKWPLAIALSALPLIGQTHPHVFIDTGIKVILDDQNRLTQITVTWVYDDLYSLLIAEDYKIDSDGDGALTDAETAFLSGFDAQWVDGFNGDLVATLDGMPLKLSGPKKAYATMRDGRIVSFHTRDVTGTPKIDGLLSLKPYDPTYYTAYDVSLALEVEGSTDCTVTKFEPDLTEEMENLALKLQAVPAQADPEDMGLPDIGARFATDVQVTCAGS